MAEQRYNEQSLSGWAVRGLMGAVNIVDDLTDAGVTLSGENIRELAVYHSRIGNILDTQKARLHMSDPKA